MKKILFLVSFIAISCSKDDNTSVEEPQVDVKNEVIVAGAVGSEGAWFNGDEPIIPYGINTVINGIVWHDNGFNGNAVFGCGTRTDTSTNPYLYSGIYFANGSAGGLQPYNINPTMVGEDVRLNAIFKDGLDLYIAGTDGKKATFWKNGFDKTYVNSNSNSKRVNDIFKSGDKIYLVGSETTGGVTVSCFWEHSEVRWQRLSINASGEATCIDIEGADVYIAGKEDDRAIYYKNGTKNFLTNTSIFFTSVNAIEVVGNDVYVVGSITETNTSNQVACYWKNGVLAKLSDGTEATDIKIKNNNIYICGYQDPTIGRDIGKVWKNGIATNYQVENESVYLKSLIVK